MARVTTKFFKVEKVHQSAPDLEVALRNVLATGERAADREKAILGHTLRLERLVQDNTFYDGEIVRKQTSDIPPEANDGGLQQLSVSEGGGIGHCIAFRYSVALQAIAIQFDNRKVSVNRLFAYLREFDPSYDYRAEALVREDAWAQYNRGLPTKLAFELASPQNLAAVEGSVGSALTSAANLAEIHEAPVIYVEIKMGRRKGVLAKSPVDRLLRYFTSGPGAAEDVRKLSATSASEDGSENVNFLNSVLQESRDLQVPEGDPDGHYEKRQEWLKTCFSAHFAYISRVYGASNVPGT